MLFSLESSGVTTNFSTPSSPVDVAAAQRAAEVDPALELRQPALHAQPGEAFG
jgi:hypothetical protein